MCQALIIPELATHLMGALACGIFAESIAVGKALAAFKLAVLDHHSNLVHEQ